MVDVAFTTKNCRPLTSYPGFPIWASTSAACYTCTRRSERTTTNEDP